MLYKETEKHGLNFLKLPLELIDGEEEWEVEQVIRHQTYQQRK